MSVHVVRSGFVKWRSVSAHAEDDGVSRIFAPSVVTMTVAARRLRRNVT
jgi:hypothetical protein